MKCPKCNYEMSVKGRRVSSGPTNKKYEWTQFQCGRHDIWIELETPIDED